jgi:hypothetical protein
VRRGFCASSNPNQRHVAGEHAALLELQSQSTEPFDTVSGVNVKVGSPPGQLVACAVNVSTPAPPRAIDATFLVEANV